MSKRKTLREIKGFRGAIYRAEQVKTRTAFAAHNAAEFLRLRAEQNGSRPRISVVVVGRNDDYMPDFADRLRATIAWNAKHLATEVIFVEWNPPADRELLSIDLAKRFNTLRGYVVSREIHEAISENSRVPLLEYHAKNVGIRRAECDWILTTNADAVFGPEMIRRLLHSPLREDVVLSAQRFDIPWREGRTADIRPSDLLRYRRVIPYHELGTGEFAFAGKQMWERARAYDEALVHHRIGVDKRGVAQMIAHGARVERAGIVFHLAHPTSCTEAVQEHHGELATLDGVPYENPPDWGLANCHERQIAERVWSLE